MSTFLRLTLVVVLASASFVLCEVAAAPVLAVTPTTLATSGDPVTISWSGVVRPGSRDMVAIYSPSTAPDNQQIGFFNCSSVTTWPSGQGMISSMLVNMRQDYEYRLWSWDDSTNAFSVVASSGPIAFASYSEPLHPHLSLTGNAAEMALMWVSSVNASTTSKVSWGTTPGTYTASAAASVSTYTNSDMCMAPANDATNPVNYIDPGFQYLAVMTGLAPMTTYYYTFGGAETGVSREFSFTTGPAVGDSLDRITLFGDLGVGLDFSVQPIFQQPPATRTTAWIEERPSSMVMHYGDISYARGHAFLWDWWFHQISNVTSNRPWMVAPGNHEIDWYGQEFLPPWSDYRNDSGGECGVPYEKRFAMPGNGNGNYYYSFDHGNIHFLVFSTETNFTTGSTQWNWMNADLAAVDRTLTPFVIVGCHRPIYSTKQEHYYTVSSMTGHIKDAIEPLLVKHNVSLFLAGHEHAYERTCAMADGACVGTGQGPIHAIIGMAGNTFQVPWLNDGTEHYFQPSFTMFRTTEWGFMEMSTNATHLHAKFRGDFDGHTHDEFFVPGYGVGL